MNYDIFFEWIDNELFDSDSLVFINFNYIGGYSNMRLLETWNSPLNDSIITSVDFNSLYRS